MFYSMPFPELYGRGLSPPELSAQRKRSALPQTATPTDVGYNQDAVKRIANIAVAHLKAGSVVMGGCDQWNTCNLKINGRFDFLVYRF